MMPRPWRELFRYATTVALGLAVDLATAHCAAAIGAQLEIAAIVGLACGAIFNYVLLKFWAFAGSTPAMADSRFIRFLVALAITAGVRAASVWSLKTILPTQALPIVILGAAAGISFTANYFLSKNWVFSQRDERSSGQRTDHNA